MKKLVLSASILALLLTSAFAGAEEKIPITASSEEALEHFLRGRDLNDRLQVQESKRYFEKAVAADPGFAQAHLLLTFAQPSAKGFFATFDRARSLADEVSEGERLWILGVEAGINGFPMKQREYYQQLVELYPGDERVYTLLGNNYFGQQEWAQAIGAYEKTTAIAPDFSQPYNQMGYAYRFLGDFAGAKKAFEKYIELIPNDPNPHDSYAELLMKMGEFDASIKSYEKALSCNPNFVASHIGIATDYNFKGEHEKARKQLEKLYGIARNDGERRAAHFATTVSYVDQGDPDKALAELEKQYGLAEKIGDAANMAGDLVAIGNILLEADRPGEAMARFLQAVGVVQVSDLSDQVKANNRRFYLFNAGRADLKRDDLERAKEKAARFLAQSEEIQNPNQIRLAHQLVGMIALAAKEYDKALTELRQASQQDPYNLYRIALALKGQEKREEAREMFERVVDFNALNNLNYAFIRHRAQRDLEKP